ncbi:MAG: helix-turn-helix transcriptional regulator [Candidatus Heimdallarchaeota archaeon]
MNKNAKSTLVTFIFLQLVLILPIVILILPIVIHSTSATNDVASFQKPNLGKTDLITEAIENQTVITHNMEVKIREDHSLKVTSTFVVANNDTLPMNYFYYEINRTISSVFVYDPIDSLDFTWQVSQAIGNAINITMRFPLLEDEIYVFSISYEIVDTLYHIGNPVAYHELDYEITHKRYSKIFNLEITLPIYSSLLDADQPAYFPTPRRIYQEDSTIYLVWKYEEKDIDDEDLFIVRFTEDGLLNRKPNLLALYIILAFLGGVGIAVLVGFLIYKKRLKPAETELVSSLLTDTEQEVIIAINQDSGVSTQRRICEKTGYSKSKVSQILAKLEEKEVLTRERWGRTNKVTISNPSFKTLGETKEVKSETD